MFANFSTHSEWLARLMWLHQGSCRSWSRVISEKQTMRKFSTILLFAGIVFLSLSANAGFKTGNDLVAELKFYNRAKGEVNSLTQFAQCMKCLHYICGIYDATEMDYGVPDGAIKGDQLCAIVSKFMDEHPERWNEPAADLVREALQKAFPKKETRVRLPSFVTNANAFGTNAYLYRAMPQTNSTPTQMTERAVSQ